MEISGRGAALVVFVIAAAAAVSLPLFLVATVFIMVCRHDKALKVVSILTLFSW